VPVHSPGTTAAGSPTRPRRTPNNPDAGRYRCPNTVGLEKLRGRHWAGVREALRKYEERK